MSDLETIALYDRQAESYFDLVEQQQDLASLNNFISQLEKNAFVLDLGCGPALASVVMREQGLRIDPIDASKAMVELANERFEISARQAYFSDLNTSDEYDAVWASFSLLHASKTEFHESLGRISNALKRNGLFYIAMKLGTDSGRDSLGRFYSYYTRSELEGLLVAAGFELKQIEESEDVGLAGEVEPWISILSQSKKHN